MSLLPILAGTMAVSAGADMPAWRVTDPLARPYLLPRLQSATVASESSYDRTGGNDDGFSGKYSFIRKEGDALVIAELKGPGVVQRLWTPTPTDLPLEFYFDGEATPRLSAPFRALFLGGVPGLPEPLVCHGAGGFACYVPLPYAVSLKVVYRGPVMQFFQINHADLPAGSPVESFRPDWPSRDPGLLTAARALLGAPGADLSALMAPPGAKLATQAVTKRLAPGGRVTLFEAKRGGRIVGFRLAPAGAFAGPGRSLVLRITWDRAGTPAILCPVGDFFGYSWGDPAMRSALVGTVGDTNYCYLPMPYARAARVELLSEATEGPEVTVRAEVVHAPVPLGPDEGRFYAVWRRENPTTLGVPFTFVEAAGHGHLVGVTLQAQGKEPGSTPFFEGDDQATIDGALTIHGTGSEDFFNGGWYDVPGRWDARRSFPLSGCLDYQKPMGRSAGYRFMLADPVVFHRSLVQCIEHAPEGNTLPTDYVGMAYLYANQAPAAAGSLAPAPERAVTDPDRMVMAAGWNVPVRAFSFQNATLTKRVQKVGSADLRVLSVRATGGDLFGDHFVEFGCEAPAEGVYRVRLEVLAGPEVGRVRLSLDEAPAGPEIDLFATGGPERRQVELGAVPLKRGPNALCVKLTPSPDGGERTGLDLITIVLERQR